MPEFLFQLSCKPQAEVFSFEFCEISKDTYSDRTPLGAVSVYGLIRFEWWLVITSFGKAIAVYIKGS